MKNSNKFCKTLHFKCRRYQPTIMQGVRNKFTYSVREILFLIKKHVYPYMKILYKLFKCCSSLFCNGSQFSWNTFNFPNCLHAIFFTHSLKINLIYPSLSSGVTSSLATPTPFSPCERQHKDELVASTPGAFYNYDDHFSGEYILKIWQVDSK